jgi:hypothetical protein
MFERKSPAPASGVGRTILRLGSLLGLALTAAATVVLSPLPSFIDDPRVFELDGNAIINLGQGGADWSINCIITNAATGANNCAPGLGANAVATSAPQNATENTPGWPFVINDPSGYTIFTQGGSKDTNDVSQWKYTSGSVPPKDEIDHGYAVAYQVTTNGGGTQPHTWIFFGADRDSTNGDSNIGIWFFQNSISANNVTATNATAFAGAPCPAGANNCNAGDLHRDGDVFISSAFTTGGSVGTVQLYHWDHSAGGLVLDSSDNGSKCTPGVPSQSLVCAIINSFPSGGNVTGTTIAPWPYQGGGTLSSCTDSPNALPPGVFSCAAFFEGGFDLTQYFLNLGIPQPCFSSFLEETRSSQTGNAQLKDFVLGNFQLCSVSIAKTCTAATPMTANDGSNFIRYAFRVDVKNDGGGLIWDPVVNDTFPTGATNTSFTAFSPGSIASGNTVSSTGTFDSLALSGVVNKITGTAAAVSGGAQTVVADHSGNLQQNIVWDSSACSPQISTTLSLNKSCTVNIIPQSSSGPLVIQVHEEFKVCNTGLYQVKHVTVSDTVSGGVKTAVPGLSDLTLDEKGFAGGLDCKTATVDYLPKSCDPLVSGSSSPGPGTAGRCTFTDEATSTGGFTDFNTTSVPDVSAPPAADATCYICPGGNPNACASGANTPSPLF